MPRPFQVSPPCLGAANEPPEFPPLRGVKSGIGEPPGDEVAVWTE